MSIKVGFYGIEAYDIILYLSQVLVHLGKKVLLTDRSIERALEHSLPELAKELPYLEFKGASFSRRVRAEDEKRYDYIITNMGREKESFGSYDYVFMLTDCQIHNIERIREIKQANLVTGIESYLIIRDMAGGKKLSYIQESCSFTKENTYYIYEDVQNLKLQLKCQYENRVEFKRLSPEAKEMLFDICIHITGEEIEDKTLRAAFRLAERGKAYENRILE